MRIFFFLLYIIFIFIIIYVERKEPQEALFWVVVMLAIPYVGLVLYLIFGSTLQIKLTAKIRAKRLKPYFKEINRESFKPEDIKLDLEAKEVLTFNHNYNHSLLSSYDDIKVFTDGKSHYESLFKDINEAQDSIYILFYTIHNDHVGHDLVRLLEKKAAEGIKVYVLIDFIANISDPPKMFKKLKKLGGKVIRIKPFLTHYRSHRKLVIIDHNISYIDGMNIGKKYLGENPKKSPWRDTQVRLTGMAGGLLDLCFYKDYLTSAKKSLQLEMINHIKEVNYPKYELNNNLCQFVMGGVETNKESIKMSYLSMIRSAKDVIRIQTPYFVPDSDILNALKTAVASGVKLEMMLPSSKSSFFLDPVTTYYIGFLLEYGAKIIKYPGYIHAKTLMIDNAICCIGSVNMDYRSMSVDDEICGVFYTKEFITEYQKIFEADSLKSKEYTYEDFLNRSRKEKILEGIFRLFAPLM